MRPAAILSVMFSLLVLLLLATRAKAIRLLLEEDTAVSVLHNEATEMNRHFIQEGSGSSKCEGHCSENSRKLEDKVAAISKSKDSSEKGVEGAGSKHQTKDEVGQNKEGLQVAAAMSPFVWKKLETYPDTLDIAGMDYSPAKKRSPIHN